MFRKINYLLVLNIALLPLLFFILIKNVQAVPNLVAEYGLNEGSGATAVDTSGNNFNGSLLNGAAWTAAGKYDKGINFDGSNDQVSVANNDTLKITSNITLEAWARANGTFSGHKHIVGKNYYEISINRSGAGFKASMDARINGTWRKAQTSGNLNLNQWYHLAGTYDGTTIKLYVDGVQAATFSTTGNIDQTNNPLRIGTANASGDFFKGTVDEVRLYNRVLNQSEIQTDMNAPIAPDTTPPSVSISTPTEGATVLGATVAVSANASDNSSVAGVQFKLDGANLGSEDTSAPYSANWDTTQGANGSHVLSAVARDGANNTTTSSVVTVNVNNPPILTITQPTEAQSISGTTVTVNYTKAGEQLAGDHAHFRLDGGTTKMDIDFDGTYVFNDVPAGNHTLLGIIARSDHSEVAGSDDSVNFVTTTPDTTAPTVDITTPLQDATVSGTINVSADASDNVGVVGVQFKLDGSNLGSEDTTAPYSVSWNTTTSTNTPHTLEAVARDAAANQTTSTVINVTVFNTDPRAQVGEWSTPINWPHVAVHAVLMPNGKVLTWEDLGLGTVWDPTSGQFTNVGTGSVDIFCAGQILLPNGKVFVVGGDGAVGGTGNNKSNLFDPTTQSWSVAANMTGLRWYPTATVLGDGKVLAMSGSTNCTTVDCANLIPEIYDPVANTWTSLNGASKQVPLYPFMFVMADGRVIHVGGSEAPTQTEILDTTAQTWTTIDTQTLEGGSATMFAPGKILKTGSSSNETFPGASLNTAYLLDLNQPTPAWRQLTSMAFARSFHNTTNLPDGQVLITGGGSMKEGLNPTNAVKEAEMWNPITETFTTLARGQNPRQYHSTALLLTDGRVMVGGNGNNYGSADQLNVEIYSPPYLFKGPRPTISSSPATIQYNSNFSITTPDGASISKVRLIRTGAVTHSFDHNGGAMDLNFSQVAGGLDIQAPASSNLAPSGYYMLFIVNSNGVPSVSSMVKLPSPQEDSQAPTVNITAPADNATVLGSITVSANASDNVGVAGVQFKVDGNNIGTEDTTSPYSITWDTAQVANGARVLTAVARDALNNSTTSAVINVIVDNPPDTTAPDISQVSATNIANDSATITWTTNEASDSQVEYGTDTQYGSTTTLNTTKVTNHSQNLTGLTNSTLYHYRVLSRDTAGNLATSGDFTFTTNAQANITFVKQTGKFEANAVDTLAASFGSLPSAGNMIIVYVWGWNSNNSLDFAATSLTDNKGNTYTRAAQSPLNNNARTAIYYATNIVSPSGTFTITANPLGVNATIAMNAVEYSGLTTLDQVATLSGSSATPTTASVTTTQGNELLVAVADSNPNDTSFTWSKDPTWTERIVENNNWDFQAGNGVEKVVSATGSYIHSWTTSVTGPWSTTIATFK